MNILMAGIDYSMAGIDIREKFSLTTSCRQKLYEEIKQNENILGSVLVSTCNRTELYLSCVEGYSENPFELLCDSIEQDFEHYRDLHKMRTGAEVFRHLCKLSCGAKSQIWGEDQIITQVKSSIAQAREFHSTDSCLEVLFRTAITAAKKIKTDIRFSKLENSVARKALAVLKKHGENLNRILVIGNGEVGRLTAQTLIDNGYDVTMTLRHYKYSTVILPVGSDAFDYVERYERLNQFDAVISATLSPHYTIEKAKLIGAEKLPSLMIDLAVPRDIDPDITLIGGVKLFDIDTIVKDEIDQSHAKQMVQINEIIDKYHADFTKWSEYRKEYVTA